MLELGARNDVAVPYGTAAEARAAYDFAHLADFLELYYSGMRVLRRERDFHELTMAYLRRAQAEGIRHAEIFFDPQNHLARGVSFAEIVDGIGRGLRRASARSASPRASSCAS